MTKTETKPTLVVRNAAPADAPAILALTRRVYAGHAYSEGMIRGQISKFRDGQFVVEYEGNIVGYAATFLIEGVVAFADHDWMSITGGGYAARHDPDGDWLYGMEVCVDQTARNLRIGQRLYDARKRLCEDWELKGIVFGGRLPGLKRRIGKYGSAEAYLEAVKQKEVRDPVAQFQIRNGFEPVRVLEDYDPSDHDSLGCATLMVWRNPYVDPELAKQPPNRRDPETVRVGTVQFQARPVGSVEEFLANVEYFVDVVADYKADFVVFPEMMSLQLLAIERQKCSPSEAIHRITHHTPRLVQAIKEMAISYNINIIGGSHPTLMEDGDIHNVAYVYLRDGSVHTQEKIHPTPDERHWWNVKGGDIVHAIPTDCGAIGILICYDVQFPELARRLTDEGARILFVPFCTDNRQAYLRVRYCSQARAIENQCYVVLSGNVGNLPFVENMDIQYAQSCILTPSDFPFARDGVASEASENVEMVSIADLDLSDLNWARAQGTVRNLRDRRFDLYRTIWLDRS